ncbi:hypothetical protein VWN77_10845, partial [Campylobacter coli]
NLSVEQLKEIFPLKAERIEKELKYQRAFENSFEQAKRNDRGLRYGKIEINANTCTLCLSCVGACNVGALIADTKENALKFNAS